MACQLPCCTHPKGLLRPHQPQAQTKNLHNDSPCSALLLITNEHLYCKQHTQSSCTHPKAHQSSIAGFLLTNLGRTATMLLSHCHITKICASCCCDCQQASLKHAYVLDFSLCVCQCACKAWCTALESCVQLVQGQHQALLRVKEAVGVERTDTWS
jgi:hypothetical protein